MDGLNVERDFQRPTRIFARITGPAGLIYLLEASVRSCARWKTELRAVYAEIAFDIRIIIGVYDRDRGGRG